MSRAAALLLHGLARTSRSMVPMARSLERLGFTVKNVGYPSRSHPLETLVRLVAPSFHEALDRSDELHLVGHSMGGLIIRMLLDRFGTEGVGRAVFIGTPNRGSLTAGRFLAAGPLCWIYGPAGRQLGPDRLVSMDIGIPPCPFGVIAGTRRFHPFNLSGYLSWTVFGFQKEHDGSVAVESTRLEGMADFAEVDVNHVALCSDPAVLELTGRFLRHGSFRSSCE
jgi:pimeloyl-ACP methyl ester carboxylesterase